MYSAHLLINENTTLLIWVNRFGWKRFFSHQSRNHMKLRAFSFRNDDDDDEEDDDDDEDEEWR